LVENEAEKLDNTIQNRRKGGRPTKRVQVEIETKLRPFFDINLPASFVATQPGMPNRHTIEKYFSIWTEELRDSFNENIQERQIITIQRFINSMQRIIFKLEYQLNKFENLIEEDRQYQIAQNKRAEYENRLDDIKPYTPKMEWEYLVLKIINMLINLHNYIAGVMTLPTAYEMHEDEILRNLKLIDENAWKKMNDKNSKSFLNK